MLYAHSNLAKIMLRGFVVMYLSTQTLRPDPKALSGRLVLWIYRSGLNELAP
jgi:hypothetical protein